MLSFTVMSILKCLISVSSLWVRRYQMRMEGQQEKLYYTTKVAKTSGGFARCRQDCTGLRLKTERQCGRDIIVGCRMPAARGTRNLRSIRAELDHLGTMSLEELRAVWRLAFKQEGRGISRDILYRMLAWRIQERAFGGYDAATAKILKQYGNVEGNVGGAGSSRHVRSGSVLVREYQGVRHTVTVVPGGFVWQEKNFSNLSKIASEITGVKWNGPRFFGLRQLKQGAAAAGAKA